MNDGGLVLESAGYVHTGSTVGVYPTLIGSQVFYATVGGTY